MAERPPLRPAAGGPRLAAGPGGPGPSDARPRPGAAGAVGEEAAFHHLADAVPHLVWMARPDGTVTYYNAQAHRYDGLRRHADGAWEWRPVLHPDDVEASAAAWRRAVEGGEPYEVEHRTRMADGSYRWHVSRARPALDDQGHTVQWYGTATDVHRIKEVEEDLREREAWLRSFADAAPAILWVTDPDGRSVFLSRAWYLFTGQTEQEALGLGWTRAVHPEDRERVEATFRRAHARQEPFRLDYRLRRHDGPYRWIIDDGQPRVGLDGSFRGFVGTVVDIHDRKQAEDALRLLNETLEEQVEARTRQVREQEARVRALALALALAEQRERQRVAYVLHDDLQQVLFGAKVAGTLGQRERLQDILDEAIGLTRALSHELSPPLLQGEDLEDLLGWMAGQQRARHGLEVEVEVHGGVRVPDPALRVFLYWLLRELLFMVTRRAGTARVRLTAERPDHHVRITVVAEGGGFEPDEWGDGVAESGLPVVRERLELVGGRLDATPAPGRGTRVVVTIPLPPE